MTSFRELEDSPLSLWDVAPQLRDHVYRRSESAFAAGDRLRDAIVRAEQLREHQRAVREKFIESLGGLPPMDTPLLPRVVGTIEQPGLRIEKIIFQSRPQTYVTANLYLPAGLSRPSAAVLFLCGHHEQAKHAEEYQIVCRILAQAGFIVLAQDPIGQGERVSYYDPATRTQTVRWGTQEHDYVGARTLLLGQTLGRYFLHDSMRGIDYLLSRPEVDGTKIAVTGNSGGGTQTVMMMLADPRIAAAVPTTFVMDRRSYMWSGQAQDAEQIWPGYTAAGFDHEDILLAMAPKPVCVLAVTSDFFPIEGTRRTVGRARRIWQMLDRDSALALHEDQSDHHYTLNLARYAATFLARHLLGKEIDPSRLAAAPIAPPLLWCTKSGQVRGEIAGARTVHDENVDQLSALQERAGHSAGPTGPRRPVEWLRQRVVAGREACPLNPRTVWGFVQTQTVEGFAWEQICWWSQSDLMGHGYLFRSLEHHGQTLPVTVAVWDEGTNRLRDHTDWLRQRCGAGRAVLVLDVSGIGKLRSHRTASFIDQDDWYGTFHKLADDLLWLGDDLASLRTWDVIRTLDMLEQWPKVRTDDTEIYAQGRMGLYGQLAAALDGRVRRVEVKDGIGSFTRLVASRHYDCRRIKELIIHGLLRHCDLDDLPRPPSGS